MTEIDDSGFETTKIHANTYIVDYLGPDFSVRVKFFQAENDAVIFAKQHGTTVNITQRQDIQRERLLK